MSIFSEEIYFQVDGKNPTFLLNIITDPDEFPRNTLIANFNKDEKPVNEKINVVLPNVKSDSNFGSQNLRFDMSAVEKEFETVVGEMAKEEEKKIATTKIDPIPDVGNEEEEQLQAEVNEMFVQMTSELDWELIFEEPTKISNSENGARKDQNKLEGLRKDLSTKLGKSVRDSVENTSLSPTQKHRLSRRLRRRMSRISGKLIGKLLRNKNRRRRRQKPRNLK